MKQGILFFSLLLFFSAAQAQNISINGTEIRIGKTKFTPGWKEEDLKEAYGPKAGYFEGYTNVHDLENAGTRVYEDGTSGVLEEVDIFMSESSANEKSPVGVFKGSLKIDGKKVEVNSNFDAVHALLKNWKTSQCFGANTYRYVNSELYIYVEFTEKDEKKIYAVRVGKLKPVE